MLESLLTSTIVLVALAEILIIQDSSTIRTQRLAIKFPCPNVLNIGIG